VTVYPFRPSKRRAKIFEFTSFDREKREDYDAAISFWIKVGVTVKIRRYGPFLGF